MKFINYLQSITGIGIYPLVSFLIFFLFFLGVAIFVIKADKTYIKTLAHIPLDTDEKQ
jgi:cytochrome c oxidase cbb3-type subunit IV